MKGTCLAYRELGRRGGVRLVLLNHWGAGLHNFDPAIVDGLATTHHVIAVNNRGIGLSGGSVPVTFDEMARCISGAELVICPNAGHGGIFQYHNQFVPKALAFLAA